MLMADGRHKCVEDLEIGDAIYSTARGIRYRRYVQTTVLDKWITVKPAYRIVLEDGTELITSSDHRFLTDRGWKHVLNTPRSAPDRPHLTTNNHLVGTGAFAPQPEESRDYRHGYLCGMVRGEGYFGAQAYDCVDGAQREARNFRLALAHIEALYRARDFCRMERIRTKRPTSPESPLHLRDEVKSLFTQWLRDHRPDLLPRYRQLYGDGAYAIPEERQRLAQLVERPDVEPEARIRGRMLDVEQRPNPAENAAPRQPAIPAHEALRLF